MEGKRKILELDISTDKITKKAAQLKKELDDLREEKKLLKKATGDNSVALAKNEAKIKAVSGKYRTAQKTLSGLVGENNEYLSVKEKLRTALNREVITQNEAAQANKELTAIRKDLNLATKEGREQAKQINQQIDKNSQFVKQNSSAYEKQKINIGNYKESVNQALKENGLFGEKIQGVKQIFNSFSPVIQTVKGDVNAVKEEYKAAGQATEGASKAQNVYNKVNKRTIASLKLLKIAIIGTGIGAFVVALGSLITFLATTQKGIDKLYSVLLPLKEVFKGLLGLAQDLGENLFDAFQRPKKSFNDFVNSVKRGYDFYTNNVIEPLLAKTENFVLGFRKRIKQARIAWNEFTGDDAEADKLKEEFKQINKTIEENQKTIERGANNIKEAYNKTGKAIGNFLNKGIDRGKEIAQLQIEIEKGQNDIIRNEAKYEAQIKEQKKIANDTSKSLEERRKAAIKGQEIAKKLTKEQNEIIAKQIKQLKLKNEANDTTRADEKKIAELEAKRFQKKKRVLEFEKNLQSQLNSITKSERKESLQAQEKEIERQNKIFEQKINNQKKDLELFILQQGIKAKSQKEELNIAQQVADRKRAILLEKYQANKISEREYQIELLKIQREFAGKQNEIAIENAKNELTRQKENIERQAATVKEKNIRLREVEQNHQKKLLEQGAINKREFNTRMQEIDNEFRKKEKEREKQRREVNKENELATEQLNFFQKKEREKQRLNELEQQEIASAKRIGANVQAVEEKFALKRERIDKQVMENKLNAASKAFGAVKGLFKEETAIAKALGIAQATIDTYIGANKALATIPPPFNFVVAGTTIAKGLMNVAKISGIALAKGDVLDDPNLPGTTTSDSIPARLSKGEAVITANAVKKHRPLLSTINQDGGGKAFARGGTPDGNRVAVRSQTNNGLIDYEKVGKAVADYMPEPKVAVTEIREQNSRRTRVEERANHE